MPSQQSAEPGENFQNAEPGASFKNTEPGASFKATAEWDGYGRLWVQRNKLYKVCMYDVDLNLLGLGDAEKARMIHLYEEGTHGYAPCVEKILHMRSVDVTKTLWDERVIQTTEPNPLTGTRHAKLSVQERYGDTRISMIAGEMYNSTPRAYLPDVDRYTAWELALFFEPGRTLDALAGLTPITEASTPHVWICPCGIGLPYACEKLQWECNAEIHTSIDMELAASKSASAEEEADVENRLRKLAHETVISGYVPVEEIAWFQRQLAARRNMNIVIPSEKKAEQAKERD